MAVFRGTRYENQPFTGVRGKDGVVRKFLHFPDFISQEDVEPNALALHTVQAGEEIDEIANKWSKKPLLWWVIASVSGTLFPLDLEPGVELVIPSDRLATLQEPQILLTRPKRG